MTRARRVELLGFSGKRHAETGSSKKNDQSAYIQKQNEEICELLKALHKAQDEIEAGKAENERLSCDYKQLQENYDSLVSKVATYEDEIAELRASAAENEQELEASEQESGQDEESGYTGDFEELVSEMNAGMDFGSPQTVTSDQTCESGDVPGSRVNRFAMLWMHILRLQNTIQSKDRLLHALQAQRADITDLEKRPPAGKLEFEVPAWLEQREQDLGASEHSTASLNAFEEHARDEHFPACTHEAASNAASLQAQGSASTHDVLLETPVRAKRTELSVPGSAGGISQYSDAYARLQECVAASNGDDEMSKAVLDLEKVSKHMQLLEDVIRQKDGHIEELNNEFKTLESERDRLGSNFSDAMSELDELKKLVSKQTAEISRFKERATAARDHDLNLTIKAVNVGLQQYQQVDVAKLGIAEGVIADIAAQPKPTPPPVHCQVAKLEAEVSSERKMKEKAETMIMELRQELRTMQAIYSVTRRQEAEESRQTCGNRSDTWSWGGIREALQWG